MWFTADEEASEVTVIARWRERESYDRLRSSDAFQQTMSQFAKRFTAPPTISVNEILVEM
ncbi:MAG: hypothetical protein GY939_23255 [Actinomycetia bacterium]|nr:hypothetical protein [Actinomycetes bacterium]